MSTTQTPPAAAVTVTLTTELTPDEFAQLMEQLQDAPQERYLIVDTHDRNWVSHLNDRLAEIDHIDYPSRVAGRRTGETGELLLN